ncbi:A/G-specific adenine glycosylase [Marivirga arenosa]|uniref:Adenine DNA glycosylase n=1 Tax=Marivirga arenosa TaxID=3059076 RepID=A0AA49JAH2_9BACT|nr:A/G-specific adenine glycosylase [Marivirga sp. ABR2-2]WKK86804.2 A/G-specific adenine glycosylase [Marivirga sp. ABR2-2]
MTESFSNLIINWYQNHKRDLPWRNTSDPYKIWLSEIILQQTRVIQGLPYYEKFIAKYPNVFDLANAPEDEVMRLWQGLGYYSRARNLHACAKMVVEQFDGKFPNTYSELLKLKGVGKYTAAAIASFAFGEATPVVDGNVFRVLARYFNITDDIAQPKTFKKFFEVSEDLIPEKHPADYNQAMMELGATVCSPKSPNCSECPIAEGCEARINNIQAELPVKKKKIKVKRRYLYYLIWQNENKIAMKKRGPQDIWQGLFDFELIETEKALDMNDIISKIQNLHQDVQIIEISDAYQHILSHQKLEAVFIELNKKTDNTLHDNDLVYYTQDEIEELPKPRLIENYLSSRNI